MGLLVLDDVRPSRVNALLAFAASHGRSTLWWCSMLGDVWFVEHCAAVAFTMLALRELAGKKPLARRFRPGNVTTGPERAHARMRNFALMLVPFVGAWVWYNFARWGVWYDIG
ncbi:MAG: hypothetical protein ACREML_00805 [Vulcanimicrobiaceae bacterium]